MSTLDLALIGNCSIGALINARADIVWACMPRFDSRPVFDSLLNDPANNGNVGIYEIELLDFERSEQHYLELTKVKSEILNSKIVRAVGPRYYQTVVDVKITK